MKISADISLVGMIIRDINGKTRFSLDNGSASNRRQNNIQASIYLKQQHKGTLLGREYVI